MPHRPYVDGTCEWRIYKTSVLDLSLRDCPQIQRSVNASWYCGNSFGMASEPCLALPLRSQSLELKSCIY